MSTSRMIDLSVARNRSHWEQVTQHVSQRALAKHSMTVKQQVSSADRSRSTPQATELTTL